MARASTAELLTELWRSLLSPLVLGGQITPLRPLGPAKARSLAQAATTFSPAEGSWVNVLRVRQARRLCPVDSLELPSPEQWAMAAALNDLMQCTNPALDGVFSKRSAVLLGKVEEILEAIAPPQTLREVLSRHATFARTLEIVRRDTRVSWWCGARDFLGCDPPTRLSLWPKLRRVQTQSSETPLARLTETCKAEEDRYLRLLNRILSLSPLTDLATVTRSKPAFEWSEPSLALLTCAPARVLMIRALRHQGPEEALKVLKRTPPPTEPAWNAAVVSVLEELRAFAEGERARSS